MSGQPLAGTDRAVNGDAVAGQVLGQVPAVLAGDNQTPGVELRHGGSKSVEDRMVEGPALAGI